MTNVQVRGCCCGVPFGCGSVFLLGSLLLLWKLAFSGTLPEIHSGLLYGTLATTVAALALSVRVGRSEPPGSGPGIRCGRPRPGDEDGRETRQGTYT